MYNFIYFLCVHSVVTKLSQLVDKLTASCQCVGNADEVFLNLSNVRNGVMMNHSSKLSPVGM